MHLHKEAIFRVLFIAAGLLAYRIAKPHISQLLSKVGVPLA